MCIWLFTLIATWHRCCGGWWDFLKMKLIPEPLWNHLYRLQATSSSFALHAPAKTQWEPESRPCSVLCMFGLCMPPASGCNTSKPILDLLTETVKLVLTHVGRGVMVGYVIYLEKHVPLFSFFLFFLNQQNCHANTPASTLLFWLPGKNIR